MRVAVLDIGSNSTRLLVADVDGTRIEELERISEVTRLGEGVDGDHRLRPEAIARVEAVLDGYALRIEAHGCDTRTAVLTSAVRDAANGPDVLELVRSRYAPDAHVLAGDEEARLTFAGAMSARDRGDRTPTLVIDIGGGSTELVVGTGAEMGFHVSLQAGVVRQTERHLHDAPPSAAQLAELAADVRATIAAGVPAAQRRVPRAAIAVAGTATSLAAIDQGLAPYDPGRVHGYVIEIATARLLLARLASLSAQDLRRVKGLHPDRAPTIVAGVAILVEVLDAFGLGAFEASEHDLLRGAALRAAGG